MFQEIINLIQASQENIYIIYGFNGVGKTRLSKEYVNLTRNKQQEQTGIYYNSYSEDIFVWDNDIENEGINPQLRIVKSSLNREHSLISEEDINEKLQKYDFNFNFKFSYYENVEEGIEFISFFNNNNIDNNIKISRGEEHIFIWCFYQCIFEKTLDSSNYIFIDDPVSSLDENNIFKISCDLYDLIEKNYKSKKIIITTHHIGLCNMLINWLTKGEKANSFKNKIKKYFLVNNNNILELKNIENCILLNHLTLLDTLNKCNENNLQKYHFVLLRQLIENISSFLGCGRSSYVLEKIGVESKTIMNIINTLSHKNIFYYESSFPSLEEKNIFFDVLKKINTTFKFKI